MRICLILRKKGLAELEPLFSMGEQEEAAIEVLMDMNEARDSLGGQATTLVTTTSWRSHRRSAMGLIHRHRCTDGYRGDRKDEVGTCYTARMS